MPSVEYQNKPAEVFPDSMYTKRLGFKTYDEALVYRGTAEAARIEFQLPRGVPVPWWGVRSAIEAQARLQGRHLLRLGLWEGAEIKGFAKSPDKSYKIEVIAHASPGIVLTLAFVIAALIALRAVIIAMQAKSVVFEDVGKGFKKLPTAAKWIAAAVIVSTVVGSIAKLKP